MAELRGLGAIQRRLKYIARRKAARAESITPMALGPAHFHPLEAQNKPH